MSVLSNNRVHFDFSLNSNSKYFVNGNLLFQSEYPFKRSCSSPNDCMTSKQRKLLHNVILYLVSFSLISIYLNRVIKRGNNKSGYSNSSDSNFSKLASTNETLSNLINLSKV